MFFVLEFSRPIQWRPRWNHQPKVGLSIIFLFIAFRIVPMRFDEYNLALMRTGQRINAPDWDKWLQDGVEERRRQKSAANREAK